MRCLHHILLSGWLLMIPPWEPANGHAKLDEEVPIRRWRQVAAFDSASKCEATRAVLPTNEDERRAWMTSRCVPAEYVYPPKRPTPK
jgi:hypothetical protein